LVGMIVRREIRELCFVNFLQPSRSNTDPKQGRERVGERASEREREFYCCERLRETETEREFITARTILADAGVARLRPASTSFIAFALN
jgi:hypothetical protein